jgi:hypothetical protein
MGCGCKNKQNPEQQVKIQQVQQQNESVQNAVKKTIEKFYKNKQQ